MEQQLALLILGDLDPYPPNLTRRASPPTECPKSRIVLCDCGALTSVHLQNVQVGKTTTCGNQKKHPRKPFQEVTSYRGMHLRLRDQHGSASLYSCVDCGRQADDWSYNGGDPDELLSAEGCAYSMKMRAYSPRCRADHLIYDGKGRR